jgi:hypothetical protein
MKTVREGSVVTLPRNDEKGTVDVFTGKGWEHHTVFEVLDNKIKLVRGKAMTSEDFKIFKSRI